MKASLRRISLLAASLALFVACSGEPISAPAKIATPTAAPSQGSPRRPLGGVFSISHEFIAVQTPAHVPRAADISVSKTIGRPVER
jgi:hypothetical protein